MKLYFQSLITLCVWLLALILLVPSDTDAAQTAEETAAGRIDTLAARVNALESQVRELERRCLPPTATDAAALPAATNVRPAASIRDAWRGIKEGLTVDEVRKVLGPPTQQLNVNDRPLWYYYYPDVGGGSVLFGENGRVVAAQEPPHR